MGGRQQQRRFITSCLDTAVLLVCAGMTASLAEASCLSLVSGPVTFDVGGCVPVQPERIFDTSKEKFAWIKDLDAKGRKQLLDSYRGLYVKGKVIKSDAIERGLSKKKGALYGETLNLLIPPGVATCEAVDGKRLAANIKEVCCDGGGDSPCLLGTGYILQDPTVLGAAASGAGDSVRQKAATSKDYKAAAAAFRAGKWKEAAKLYEHTRTQGELDVLGHYNLGFAYRKLDQCGQAISPLQVVYNLASKQEIGADEEKIARKATLLLARCQAKLNDPGAAVLVLQGYLLEPKKYRWEIKQSLTHKDFGWIHTSKEYVQYKKDALKKLKN